MTVYFIGTGPGAADLVTLRAARLISRCGTCLLAGDGVPADIVSSCPPTARIVDTSRMPLEVLVAEFRAAQQRGDDVARLYSGDPSVYSSLDKQIRALDAEGIPWEIVPGVSGFSAAAASLGVELLVPHVSRSVILTSVDGRDTSIPAGKDLAVLCDSEATTIIRLSVARLFHVVRELIPAYGAECPAAVVACAGSDDEVTIRGTLADITDRVSGYGFAESAVLVVGRILDRTRGDQHPAGVLPSGERHRAAGDPAGEGSGIHSSRTHDTTGVDGLCRFTSPRPPGRILVLGGTSEGRHLADRMVTAGLDVVTSLAGRVSRPRLPRGEIRIGGFGGPDGLAHWMVENGVSAVIDATHPFAERISTSAALASAASGIPLLRLHRPAWSPRPDDEWIRVADMAEAARVVQERFRRPMLTVGRQGLGAFAHDTRGSYLIRCVEPPVEPLPRRYLLVLDRGPFGMDSERTLMARHRIDVLVTKNSGGQATEAKLAAARLLRIPVVMVDRPVAPAAETVHTVDDAARWLVARFGSR